MLSTETSKKPEDLYDDVFTTSTAVIVVGKSGRGKTTALKNMNPAELFLINVKSKRLPFLNAREFYKTKNIEVSDDASYIIRLMRDISAKRPEIKNIVIDDGQYIMASEFVRKATERGYDKFSIMARNMWNILTLANQLRGDLKVFFLCHEEDTGTERKMKTIGRMLDEKLTPEGLCSIVLYADIIEEGNKKKYVFTTQSDGITNAKSPYEMFPDIIPNDLDIVSKRIDEFYQGIPMNKSKLNMKVS